MLRIGLTGGIGSGKTQVSNGFALLGIPIIDTDEIARSLSAEGTAGARAIAALFGNAVLNAEGQLNRQRLRKIVFSKPAARAQLEQLLHPLIEQCALQQMAQLDAPYCIFVVPLLLEKGWQRLVDRILVVDALEEQQIERTLMRDKRPVDEVRAIMNSQRTRKQRLAAADDIIDNTRTEHELRAQIQTLHQRYLHLAADQARPTTP